MILRCRRPCLASTLLVVLFAGLWWPSAKLAAVPVARPRPAGTKPPCRKIPYPKVRIEYVGQELRGHVKSVGVVADNVALVNVGRGRPCMLLEEDMEGGMVEQEQILKVWVKEIFSRGKVMLTMRKPVLHLQAGDLVRGVVTHVDKQFGGIFLDVGAQKDGMLLPGQLTPEYNASLSEPVRKGMDMEVWVKDVRDDGTFALTMFRPEIRLQFADLEAGQELQGKIRKIPRFGGAFLDVGAEKDGWLPDGQVPEGASIGQELTVWVKEVTRESGLQLLSCRPKYADGELLVGAKLRGNVTGLPKFGGAFVDIGAARDGLLNQADMIVGNDKLELGQHIDVWVKQRRGSSTQLTMVKPLVSWRGLRKRKELRGRVDAFSMGGGVFVDVGFVNHVMLRREDFDPENRPRLGQHISVWVKAKHKDGTICVTMFPPTPTFSRGGTRMRRGIL